VFCRSTGGSCTILWLPFIDDTLFYKAVVNPYWEAGEGEEPNLKEALDAIKTSTCYNHLEIVSVWIDVEEMDIDYMVAVASASRDMDMNHISQLSWDQLNMIGRATWLEGVKPRWMQAMYRLDELREMNVAELWFGYFYFATRLKPLSPHVWYKSGISYARKYCNVGFFRDLERVPVVWIEFIAFESVTAPMIDASQVSWHGISWPTSQLVDSLYRATIYALP
jgi:hypothetical protein